MNALILGVLLAIDPAKSTATFLVQHVFVERVTGTVPIVSGSIDVAAGTAVPTHVEATLDPAGLKTDEPDRDAALRGADWFDVKQFPTWTFVSTKITPTAKGFSMEGTLTMHGVPQAEIVDVIITGAADRPSYRATAQIDRHAFGMAKTRLDPAIGGIVTISLQIVSK